MSTFRYRLIDTAGGEIGIILDPRLRIEEGQDVQTPAGQMTPVIEVYDDEEGKEGDVQATLVVEE